LSVRTLYDSYIRAIKWATLRIRDRGVIAYVTNGGFIDSNSADGLRKTLADEFSAIHVFNLRGNQRTAGEQSRREGGKVFGGGSRATVAITVLVKNPERSGPAAISYTDIGDYLSTEQKLAKVAETVTIFALDSVTITSNKHGDWINQRRDDFARLLPLAPVESPSLFALSTFGLTTNRDAWCYNFSSSRVIASISQLVGAYRESRSGAVIDDPKRISWSRALRSRLARGQDLDDASAQFVRLSTYRPFTKVRSYFYAPLNEVQAKANAVFPPGAANCAIYQVGVGSDVPFSVLALDSLPDLHVTGAGSGGAVFPRWRYEQTDESGMLDLGGDGQVIDGYRKVDNITDEALKRFRASYPAETITKDDIFFYVYGLLHSPEYRETYAADLKKMLPRIPFVRDFRGYADAGRALSDLHLRYETVTPYPLEGLDVAGPGGDAEYDFFAVGDKKMRFGKPTTEQQAAGEKADRSVIHYNDRITLSGIPLEAHRYMLGSRSAIEWIIDRYYVKTDKTSGIVNDPNDWSREVGDSRYILDLLARIVTVSLETMTIVDNLPPLEILEGS